MKSLSGVGLVLCLFFYFVALTLLVDPKQNFWGYVTDLIVAFFIVFIPARMILKVRK